MEVGEKRWCSGDLFGPLPKLGPSIVSKREDSKIVGVIRAGMFVKTLGRRNEELESGVTTDDSLSRSSNSFRRTKSPGDSNSESIVTVFL